MITIETSSKLNLKKLQEAVRGYFGPEGLGLTITEDTDACLNFEGGGGFVKADFCGDGPGSSLTLSGREYDQNIRDFISKLR